MEGHSLRPIILCLSVSSFAFMSMNFFAGTSGSGVFKRTMKQEMLCHSAVSVDDPSKRSSTALGTKFVDQKKMVLLR